MDPRPQGNTSSYWSDGRCIWPSIPRRTGLIKAMHGLGDTLYQRAFIRAHPGAYVETPWPELLSDLDVHCIKPSIWLHYTTPKDSQFAPRPPYLEELEQIKLWYFPRDLEEIAPYTITGAFERRTRLTRSPDIPLVWDLPPLPPSRHPGCAFVRPVSVRGSNYEPSRGCSPQYIIEVTQELKKAGYTTVSASYAKEGVEWNLDAPEVDHAYNEGQLSTLEMLALVKEAAVCVGPVCWYAPAAMCARSPCAIIMGGYQKHNAPHQIVDELADTSNIQWFQTDNPCHCADMAHQCDKTITGFREKFGQWLTTI